MQQELNFFAPAKINLYLQVTGRRPDGYHLLDSLVVFATIGDRLSFSPAPKVTLTCEGEYRNSLSTDIVNTITSAASRLNYGGNGATILLEKNLPIASGIGGGSSDAAATLKALNQLWNLNLNPKALHSHALALGADVPMCLYGKAAFVSGIGEIIHPLAEFPPLHAVLVNPGAQVATPAIFAAYKQDEPGFDKPMIHPKRIINYYEVLELLEHTDNRLQTYAISACPAIDDVLYALRGTGGCALARMSGSGATCFGLYEEREDAIAAADAISAGQPKWWVRQADLS